MASPKCLILLSLIGSVSASFAQTAPPVPSQFTEMSKIVGKPGTFNADGSYRINVARSDVKFVSDTGMAIPADLGLSTYLALSGTPEKVLGVGDVAMLANEIDNVIDVLRSGRFEVVALHNHMTSEQPRLFYMHFEVTGRPSDVAMTFKKALDVLGHGKPSVPVTKVGKPTLDADALAAVLGVKPQKFPSGVLRYANPRKGLNVTIDGLAFTPAMGIGSWAAFNACECGQTMVMGDTCCVRADLQAAIDAYRKAGIHITGIHNHFFGGSQEVMFMHFEGEGDSVDLAKGIRNCWDALGK